MFDTAMDFELTMRIFFGNNAYQIAAGFNDHIYRKKWLLKVMRQIKKLVDNLDTSLEHKQVMLNAICRLEEKVNKESEPSWEMIYTFLRLCGFLLGYKGVHERPIRMYSLFYYQDEDQFRTEGMLEGNESVFPAKNDIILARAKIALELKNKGFTTFHIGLILSISEYEVKKLLKYIKDKD